LHCEKNGDGEIFYHLFLTAYNKIKKRRILRFSQQSIGPIEKIVGPIKILGTEVLFRDGRQPETRKFFEAVANKMGLRPS
jgi:hypothetical protein